MDDMMTVSRESLEANGFILVSEMANRRFAKRIGERSEVCFGNYFGGLGSFYLMINDGNDGHIFIGLNPSSWDQVNALIPMLDGVTVDVGHTLTAT